MEERRSRAILIPEDLDDLQTLCIDQRKEIEALKAENREQKMKIQETKYKAKRLSNELGSLKALEKTRSAEMDKDRQNFTQKMLDIDHTRSSTVAQCRRALILLTGLERHTQHGHHFILSRTAVSLLFQIRQLIDAVIELNSTDAYPDILERGHTSPSAALMADDCGGDDVEANLKYRIHRMQKEISVLRDQEQLIELIPQYRREISKLKTECKCLRSELDDERRRSGTLLKLLNTFRAEVKTLSGQDYFPTELRDSLENSLVTNEKPLLSFAEEDRKSSTPLEIERLDREIGEMLY